MRSSRCARCDSSRAARSSADSACVRVADSTALMFFSRVSQKSFFERLVTVDVDALPPAPPPPAVAPVPPVAETLPIWPETAITESVSRETFT